MLFDVAATAYDRFMGRYRCCSRRSSPTWPGSRPDSGCSTSAAGRARSRPSSSRGSAQTPSRPSIRRSRSSRPRAPATLASTSARLGGAAAVRGRHVRRCSRPARRPLHGRSGRGCGGDGTRDPAGRRRRACVWDHAGGQGPLGPLWDAARALDPTSEGESRLVGSHEGELERLFESAGLRDDRARRRSR